MLAHKYNIVFIDSSSIRSPDIIVTNMSKASTDIKVVGFQFSINNRALSEVTAAIEERLNNETEYI